MEDQTSNTHATECSPALNIANINGIIDAAATEVAELVPPPSQAAHKCQHKCDLCGLYGQNQNNQKFHPKNEQSSK